MEGLFEAQLVAETSGVERDYERLRNEDPLFRRGRRVLCLPTSAREEAYSAVFGRLSLYSLSSSPLDSRAALNALPTTTAFPA